MAKDNQGDEGRLAFNAGQPQEGEASGLELHGACAALRFR